MMTPRGQARATGRRGTTMVEVMTVVAILGIFASMGGAGLLDMVKATRVVSSSKGLVAMLRSARVRAAALNCPFYVQLNGPAYSNTSVTGFPTAPGTMTLLRKANCATTVMSFEVGDVVVDRQQFGPEATPSSVTLELPATVLSTQTLTNQSVVVAYDPLGARSMWFDATGVGETGFSSVSAVDGLDVTLSLHEQTSGTPQHNTTVLLPTAGEARFQ